MAGIPTSQRKRLIIEPPRGLVGIDFGELWRSRELLSFFYWRDNSVHYRNTIIGYLWVVFRPTLMVIVFTVMFHSVGKFQSHQGVPYPLFSYAGLLCWQFFASGVYASSNSLIAQRPLITKVYFPRIFVPISALLANLIDFLVSLLFLFPFLIYFHLLSWKVLAFIVLIPAMVMTGLGPAIWLSALVAYFRDVKHLIPLAFQVLMFISPVAYGSDLVPEAWRPFYAINPLVGLIDCMRWSLFDVVPFPWQTFPISLAASLLIFTAGVIYFRQVESGFAEVV